MDYCPPFEAVLLENGHDLIQNILGDSDKENYLSYFFLMRDEKFVLFLSLLSLMTWLSNISRAQRTYFFLIYMVFIWVRNTTTNSTNLLLSHVEQVIWACQGHGYSLPSLFNNLWHPKDVTWFLPTAKDGFMLLLFFLRNLGWKHQQWYNLVHFVIFLLPCITT